MTKAQYEREKLRQAREKQRRILAEAREHADQGYVRTMAGFWLERWAGKRHPTRGTHRRPPMTMMVNSGFLLST